MTVSQGTVRAACFQALLTGDSSLLLTRRLLHTMPQLGNITVSIVNADTGAKFEEYQVSKRGNKLNRYIESKAGQKFKVVIELQQGDKPIKELYRMHLEIDGEDIQLKRLVGRQRGQFLARTEFEGEILGSNQFAPYMFSDTKITGVIPFFKLMLP